MKRFSLFAVFAALFSLIVMNANSQNTIRNYDSSWKKIEGFVKKGLPASAIAEVKKVYTRAKKEKQNAQVIKSLIYLTTLQNENRENNDVLSIAEIEKEIPGTTGTVNALLNSLLATRYQAYYEQNRWQIFGRTQTVDFKKDDIATWSTRNFFDKISELYLRSLTDKKLLQRTPLSAYDAIIVKGNVRHLRPTLFDMLAFQALQYFDSDERYNDRPSYSFEINQASAFDPAADFIHRKFDTKDTASLHYKALLIYQELIAFHLEDKNPAALIDADIHRYQFVRGKSTHPNKEEYYFNGINHIAHQYEDFPAASIAWYYVADFYNNQGTTYDPAKDTTYRFSKVKAREIAERIAAQKDSSEGKLLAATLLEQIDKPSLLFNVEQVNLPGKPFRALVKYKNLPEIYLRIVKSSPALRKAAERSYEDSYWKTLLAAPSLKTWKQSLPDTKDFQEHGVEIKVDPLPSGEYLLIASADESFKNNARPVLAGRFFVSAISYLNNGADHFVLNRDNGQPLRNATVQIWEEGYDYSTSRYIKQKGASYKTNDNGFFHLIRKPARQQNNRYNNYAYSIEVTTNDDHLFIDQTATTYYYNGENEDTKNQTRIFLFKDRGIYRPGQTVYFKGIALSKKVSAKTADILTNYITVIRLMNPNGEAIDSIKVKTNEFGSFSGKFQLPAGGLTGRFSITAGEEAYSGFSVEEYKRPKFYVNYDTLKGTYRVNDTIEITGIAKAYAGNNIDGAQVKYRVVRQARFLYPWMSRRWWFPPSAPMEIVNGETITDAAGKFRVKFTAIPDLKIDEKLDPAFDYVVYADITDINGETRGGEKTVSVSYKSLLLKTEIAGSMPADSLNKISLRTENNNGEFEPALVTVKILKLQPENRLIRNRLWDKPDQFVFTKEEYLKLFPNDEYDDEKDPSTWKKDRQVLERTDSTRKDQPFILDGMIAESGNYAIEITTKDKDGKEVKDIQYVELYQPKAGKPEQPVYFRAGNTAPIQPGQTAEIEVSSSADNLFLIQQVNKSMSGKDSANISYSFIRLSNEKKKLSFAATEADRGGYGVNWAFVKHNQLFTHYQPVSIPWTNKELKIEYASYRDKTLPGSQEQWKLRISGLKNEKAAAEMLAGMYDASLDEFAAEFWNRPDIWPTISGYSEWNARDNFFNVRSQQWNYYQTGYNVLVKDYDRFIFDSGDLAYMSYRKRKRGEELLLKVSRAPGVQVENREAAMPAAPAAADGDVVANGLVDQTYHFTTTTRGEMFVHGEVVPKEKNDATENIQPRKNFNETAFFFPDLRTDSTGAIEFSFTLPEALTKWKFQALAHTKELAFGYSSKEVITQKDLMVQPNTPRFLREGDQLVFNAKIVNLSDKELSGNAELQLFNTATNQPVAVLFGHTSKSKSFKIAAGQSTVVLFPLTIPASYADALTWKVVAKAESFSDGEENVLPVLSNRMLVTETISLPMRGSSTKTFSFDKLKRSGNSNTLKQHSLTVEYTSNPGWYAVQALPYLMEYPYECAEQTWNRYYANSLAASIANTTPRLKQLFARWKTMDTAALMSNLQKNQELKSILLAETPWVLEAKTEAQQKQNIGLLFDMVRMSGELSSSFEKLKRLQSSNGGFVWFSGGPDDRYMTQYIVTGIGHLFKLNSISDGHQAKLRSVVQEALPYLDRKIKEDYDNLVKYKTDLKKYVPGYSEIQYFYMRSFFPEYKPDASVLTAYNYFRSRLSANWTGQNKYMQGMLALALHRLGDKTTPSAILKSLKETAISNEELGMYWKDANPGWWWYQAPVERQSILIEAFSDIAKDTKTVNDLRTWLLKNKQTNKWESTKATAEACYALLLTGSNWLNEEPVVNIKLGDITVNSTDNKQESGTGYFSKTFRRDEIKPDMGNISVTVSSANTGLPTWGGVYWQYFENLDKITTAATPLQLQKKLFVQTNSDRGPVLTPLKESDKLKIGDKIIVRIELRADRDMEYVHMKDMRASAFEPVNVLSSYKWQDGLGYYESTKDAATNFFFDKLRKGVYVFEYALFVTHSGSFSNGLTTIQCMYAPEFSAHSEGLRVTVQ